MATIATHFGGQKKVAISHNRRDEKVVEKEVHIQKEGVHEIWYEKNIRDLYKEVFDEAVAKYNNELRKKEEESGKNRPERYIKDYYLKIKKEKQKQCAYEQICGVYAKKDKKNDAIEEISPEIQKSILNEYYEWFRDEYKSNFVIVGVYYHFDECGKDPHLHIDFFPVARNLKRGMETQNSLSQALYQMGFTTKSKKDTNQMQFERECNDKLEEICKKYNISVEHPMREKFEQTGTHVRHKSTQKYIEDKLRETEEETNRLKQINEEHKIKNDGLDYQIQQKEIKQKEIVDEIEKQRETRLEMDQSIKDAEEKEKWLKNEVLNKGKEYNELEKKVKEFKSEIRSLTKEKEALEQNIDGKKEEDNKVKAEIKENKERLQNIKKEVDGFDEQIKKSEFKIIFPEEIKKTFQKANEIVFKKIDYNTFKNTILDMIRKVNVWAKDKINSFERKEKELEERERRTEYIENYKLMSEDERALDAEKTKLKANNELLIKENEKLKTQAVGMQKVLSRLSNLEEFVKENSDLKDQEIEEIENPKNNEKNINRG